MTQQCYGIVTALDYATCRVRVRLPDQDNVETYWLHLPQTNTVGVQRRPILPAIGEQVTVLLDADGAGGTIRGGVYHAGNPPPVTDPDTDYVRFADGTTVTYNQASHAMLIDGPASVTVIAKQVTVKADAVTLNTPQMTCNGDVHVNGNIHATGSVTDDGGNSNHHSH